MRYPLYLLPVASVAAWAPSAWAQAAADSSEVFLDAYMNVQQAEKLEAANNMRAALAKYRYAGSLLDQLHQRDPEWQKVIVAYRRKKTAEAIAKLEKWLATEEPAGQVPAMSGGALQPNFGQGGGSGDIFEEARKQMLALQQQLKTAQAQLEASKHERTKLRVQLEAAIAQLNAQAGGGVPVEPGSEAEVIQQLRAELAQMKAQAAEAQAQWSRAVTTEDSLEEQLAAAEAAGGPNAVAQITALQRALEEARADREVAEEQNELLNTRLKEMTAAPGGSQQAEARAKELEAANDQIAQQLADAQVQIEALEASSKLVTQERDASKEKEKELTGKLGETEKALEEKNTELAKAEEQLIAAAKEKVALTEERDKAVADLATATSGQEELQKLVAENRDLMQKLEEATTKVDAEKEKEIKELQAKITESETKLLESEAQNEKHQASIKELEEQLKSVPQAPEGSEEQKKLAEENELLRGIVLREREDQGKRDKARKAIIEELSRLQVRSRELNEQVEVIAQAAQPLTERERALFKGPQLEIVDNQSTAMSISILAPQVSSGEAGNDAQPDSGVVKTSTARLSEDALKRLNLSEDLRDLAREGREKFDDGDFVGAERTFEALVSRAPDNVFGLTNLATARYRNGKLPQAVETFQQVIKLAPEDAFSHATLGIIYYKQNNYDAAVESLTRSLAINPKNATAHNYLGVAAAQKGWKDAARKEIETAIQINPEYADAHFNLAVVLATAQPPDKENARKHYKRAVALGADPDKALEELIR